MEAYLLHDANAGSNLKLMIMIQEEGMKGYGIYWTVLEFLRLQNEYKASLKVIPILAQKARVTTATLKRIIYDAVRGERDKLLIPRTKPPHEAMGCPTRS